MATPDGSIHIDTKINAAGVNQGTQQIAKAAQSATKPMQGLGKSLGNILNIVRTIGKALIAAFVGGAILNAIKGVIGQFDILGSSVGDKFRPLVDALDTLKGAFVNLIVQALIPLIPYIVSAVQWFTTMLQTVTQIVAALFGFKQTVGNIMTTAAANAKKAAKEAKGALAAFDQINVLQKQQAPETPTGPTATPGPITIPDDLFERVQRIKDALLELFGPILEGAKRAWKLFTFLWNEFWKSPIGELLKKIAHSVFETWKKMFDNIVDTLKKIWDGVVRIAAGIIEFLVGVFRGDWELAWEGLKDIVGGMFEIISAIIEGAVNHMVIWFEGAMNLIRILIAPVVDFIEKKWRDLVGVIKTLIDALVLKWQGFLDRVKVLWSSITNWFKTNVFAPIANGFGSMLTDIKLGFEATFNGIKGFIKGIINNIIDYINNMIQGIVFGINAVIGAANAVGELVGLPELSTVTAPQIPRLATGAVIPANSQFLAVLGDQKSGRNIEAPEALIRQIVREETGKMQADITIRFEGTLAQLVRELKPHIDRENVRIGGNLIKSGVVAK